MDDILALLKEVRDACLYTEDGASGDYIGITDEPYISESLFARICDAINHAEGRS